ncbi:MAG: GNAT family N-acetyltransferase [Dactylosporangium sp.]|nr:GNAT family N-acetyltransferase [Dactylosporangium sp.]NNJ63912.1 GNAT family N-acetyltransferase [Dactylosporangium sp.]
MIAVRLAGGEPRRAGHDQARVLARLVATAFADLPVVSWLVPLRAERPEVLPRYFRILVDHALHHGWVDMMPDRSAVAVWLPAGDPSLAAITDYDQRLADACRANADRFRQLDQVMHDTHPGSPPHEHLALLAVDPRRQGTGLGSRLLDHRHRLLDQHQRPAYLEASTMRSARLYQRHGYHHIAAPFAPASCGASMWPMWREPQPAQTR